MTTNDGCRADVRKARAEAAEVETTAAAVRAAKAEALREAADELGVAVTYEGGYIDVVVLPDALRDRADRLATDTAAPEGNCLAGSACVRLTTNGCRPICGFTPAAPVAAEGVETEWSPVEPVAGRTPHAPFASHGEPGEGARTEVRWVEPEGGESRE